MAQKSYLERLFRYARGRIAGEVSEVEYDAWILACQDRRAPDVLRHRNNNESFFGRYHREPEIKAAIDALAEAIVKSVNRKFKVTAHMENNDH